MNKTIIINISGIVFHIEEDAYDVLRNYMIDVKRHFGQSLDSVEIVGDIENRIAEMFSERIVVGRKEVITSQDVAEIIAQMGRVSDFDTETADPARGTEQKDNEKHFGTYPEQEAYQQVPRRLYRDPQDRILGGVCSGVGHYFNVEPRWIRIAWILLLIIFGVGLLVYIVMWIVVPKAVTRADRMAMRGEAPNLQNFKRSFEEEMEGLRKNFTGTEGRAKNYAHSVGSGIKRFLIFCVKCLAVLVMLFALGGLLSTLVAVVAGFGFMNQLGLESISPFTYLDPATQIPAWIGLACLLAIPLFVLFVLTVRVVFNRKMIGRYAAYTLAAIWLGSLAMLTVIATQVIGDHAEQSTLVEVEDLVPNDVYTFIRKDVRKINLGTKSEWSSEDLHLELGGSRVFRVQRAAKERGRTGIRQTNVAYLFFKKTNPGEKPHVSLEYQAKGATYELASERASQITYPFEQEGNIIQMGSNFSVPEGSLNRDQKLRVFVNLPVGTEVRLHQSLLLQARGIRTNRCEGTYPDSTGKMPEYSTWVMSEDGLVCVPNTN